ncbi:hypothetical protein KR018_005116 [Drosophila ironensis]|nr:hypothetical protein KR018_005116 [Drosophila ironensis]
MFSIVLVAIQAAPAEVNEDVTHPPPEQLQTESRSSKDDVLEVDDDLDGRSAYVNNQFVPSEPVEVVDDVQNAPLYEILQKQMEQVLASSGPNDPVYEHREKQERRDQQPPHQPPLFSGGNRGENDLQDDYDDEEDQTDQGYAGNPEKPDAEATSEEEEHEEAGYQTPQLSKPSSTTTRRPNRRRTTTAQPRRTKPAQPRTTVSPVNQTSSTEAPYVPSTSHRPKTSTSAARPQPENSLPSDPQVYQHKRRILFKTISTGSQFLSSPIGDLIIKFSIGFAKPPAPGPGAAAMANPSSEALRTLSNSILKNLELQKQRRANKVQKE